MKRSRKGWKRKQEKEGVGRMEEVEKMVGTKTKNKTREDIVTRKEEKIRKEELHKGNRENGGGGRK